MRARKTSGQKKHAGTLKLESLRWPRWGRIPETCGIVLEKAEQQLSQRRLVSGIVGWDIFGSFWNRVNVEEGIKALLKMKTRGRF